MDNYKEWIGKEISRSDIVTPRLVDHFKKTLEPNYSKSEDMPEGLFFCLCPDVSSLNELSIDGNSKLGIFLPDLPYKNRMWAGGKVSIHKKFKIGWEIEKISKIENIEFKQGATGKMCFVTINHDYKNNKKIIINEKQVAVYREKINKKNSQKYNNENIELIDKVNIYGSSTLLFRYSALTFNGHKIHYDIDYTKKTEGHSSLLIHAPLQATYLLNIAKKNNITFNSFEYRAVNPLFFNKEFSIEIGKNNNEIIGRVISDDNIISMKATFK